MSYRQVVCLRNGYFNVGQAARERIAAGLSPKEPMASVDGEFDDCASPSYDGIELHMNPKREHLFRDLNGYAVRYAQFVTVVGHSCFVRGIVEYYCEDNAPPRAGNTVSQAKLLPATVTN